MSAAAEHAGTSQPPVDIRRGTSSGVTTTILSPPNLKDLPEHASGTPARARQVGCWDDVKQEVAQNPITRPGVVRWSSRGPGGEISSLIMSEVTLTAPKRRTAADEAERALFQSIASGAIPPGAQLRLQELCEQLQMSMMPIREAIQRLQALGLVEVVAHRGCVGAPADC